MPSTNSAELAAPTMGRSVSSLPSSATAVAAMTAVEISPIEIEPLLPSAPSRLVMNPANDTDLANDPEIAGLRRALLEHPLYARLRHADDLRTLQKWHVFAVWDFMSLLKSLQRQLTCVRVPWMATPHRELRRMVNEIVLAEESDEDGHGGYASHFELYLQAMSDTGADRGPMDRFLEVLGQTGSEDRALRAAQVPQGVADFVRHTLATASAGALPEVAAAFAYGREDVIPEMFERLVRRLSHADPASFGRLAYYLDRHIHTDGQHHGPQARRLVETLCEGRDDLRDLARAAAIKALALRLRLWDAILRELD